MVVAFTSETHLIQVISSRSGRVFFFFFQSRRGETTPEKMFLITGSSTREGALQLFVKNKKIRGEKRKRATKKKK